MKKTHIAQTRQYLSDVFRRSAKGQAPIAITLQPEELTALSEEDCESLLESRRSRRR